MIIDRRSTRSLIAARQAVTSIEFALVGTILLLLTFASVEIGLILWTKNVLQSTAAIAARCGAIQASGCTTPGGVQSFAVTTASTWLMSGAINASNVTVSPSPVTTCGTLSGRFEQVNIQTSAFATHGLPNPFGNKTISETACYPCVSC